MASALMLALTACGPIYTLTIERTPTEDDDTVASLPSGYEAIEAFGKECSSSYGVAPKDYGPLKLIPCTSGAPGCVQVVPERRTQELGYVRNIDANVILDDDGRARALLVRPSEDDGLDGYGESEAVVYDLATLAPTVAFRAMGERNPKVGSKDGACRLHVAASTNGVVLLGTGADGADVSATRLSLTTLGALPSPVSLSASPTKLTGPYLSSSSRLVAAADDGALVHLLWGDKGAKAHYGPGERVTPVALLGDELLVTGYANAATTFLFAPDGTFRSAPQKLLAQTDGRRVVWLEASTLLVSTFTVKSRGIDEPDANAKDLATVSSIEARATALGDGMYAVLDVGAFGREASVVLVDVATGATSSAVLGGDSDEYRLVGVSAGGPWLVKGPVTERTLLQVKTTAFAPVAASTQ